MLVKGEILKLGGPDSPDLPKMTLIGRSRAGEATNFAIPELKWMFDCGALVQGWKPKAVFVTHTHSDHCHFLTHIKHEPQPPDIYLPDEASPFFKSYMLAFQELSDCMTEEQSQGVGNSYHVDYVMRPTKVQDEFTIRQGKTEFVVKALKMDHRIACLGYSIFQIKSKIKPEYAALKGPEIGRLRKEGVQITQNVKEPFICFMGDTTSKVFDTYHPEVLSQHKVIVVECSFIDDGDVERAKKTTHMHWNDLKRHVQAHPETFFVLIHFSLKYSSLRLRNFFAKQQLEEGCDNVHPVLDRDEIEQAWKKVLEKRLSNNTPPPSDDEYEDQLDETVPQCKCRVCRNKAQP